MPHGRSGPPPQRILLIRPSALGDVCRSVPVLASLRRAYPEARIDWLVQDSFADAIRHHPGLTNVVPFDRRATGSALKSGRTALLRDLLRRLREPRYDLVIDAQGLFRSGFFAWATGAPRRVGYANARELGWLGLNERHTIPPDMHAVDRMLELARRAGIEPIADMRLYAPPDDRAAIAAAGRFAEPYAVIAPTSRWPGKLWPAERFAEAAGALLARGLPRIVLVGSRGEREQIAPLLELAEAEPRVIDLVGQTSIGRLMALIERAALVIALDSAALHIAVGFGRPIVALFGPTRVSLVGPYQRDGDVIQHVRAGDPSDHKDADSGRSLMDRIRTEEVVAAADHGARTALRPPMGRPA
jgi:lipopolysaccharide heptosyltransferase I